MLVVKLGGKEMQTAWARVANGGLEVTEDAWEAGHSRQNPKERRTQSCPVPNEHVGPFVQKAERGTLKGTRNFTIHLLPCNANFKYRDQNV